MITISWQCVVCKNRNSVIVIYKIIALVVKQMNLFLWNKSPKTESDITYIFFCGGKLVVRRGADWIKQLCYPFLFKKSLPFSCYLCFFFKAKSIWQIVGLNWLCINKTDIEFFWYRSSLYQKALIVSRMYFGEHPSVLLITFFLFFVVWDFRTFSFCTYKWGLTFVTIRNSS